MTLPQYTALVVSRFWAKVDKSGTCWLWRGGRRRGYGVFHYGSPTKQVLAHRFAYFVTFGPIPDGHNICHRCDNPACVRPDHLFVGTVIDNMADMRAKWRHAHGSQHWMAKLSETDVEAIREAYATGRITQERLAQRYGVARATIWRILRNRLWRHVA